MEINNWILKKHLSNIEIVSNEYLPFYLDYLEAKGVLVNQDLSKVNSFVNWDLYINKFSFFYDYENNTEEIKNLLSKSRLSDSDKVSMDFGYDNPIILIKTEYFIDNWKDFIVGALYESAVVSEDGRFIMEFLKGYTLTSNFIINK